MMSSSPTCLGIIPASTIGGSISDNEGLEVDKEEESDSAELRM